ncbi:MAG TPA: hypothetical protein VIP98_00650 [Microlunatus sp.]
MPSRSFHGAPGRFDVVAAFVADRFPEVRFVADVAGGQGMLSRILAKRYNLDAEVVDPRGWVLRGVSNRPIPYTADLADFYDLIIGLHPDQALRPVVESAATVPVLVVPCCNFWSPGTRLGRDALLDRISDHHAEGTGSVEPVVFDFAGPMNRGLVLLPPARSDPIREPRTRLTTQLSNDSTARQPESATTRSNR